MKRNKHLASIIIPVAVVAVLVASLMFWRATALSEKETSSGLRNFDFLSQVKGPPGQLHGVIVSNGKPVPVERELTCPFDGDEIMDAIKLARGKSKAPVRSELYGEIAVTPTIIDFGSLAEHYGLPYEIVDFNRRLQPPASYNGRSYAYNSWDWFINQAVPDRLDEWSGTAYRIRSVNIATCDVEYEKFNWSIQNAVSISKADLQKFGYFIFRLDSVPKS